MVSHFAELVEFEDAVKMAEATIAAVGDEIVKNTRRMSEAAALVCIECLRRLFSIEYVD